MKYGGTELGTKDRVKLILIVVLSGVLFVFDVGCSDDPTVENKASDNAVEKKYEPVGEVAKQIPGFKHRSEETFSCGGVTNTVSVYQHEKTGLEFVLVPGGKFWMETPNYEREAEGQEGSKYKVVLPPFLICRTECTQEAWDRVGGKDRRHVRGTDIPIHGVNWDDAKDWCSKAGLRLPFEAEWEYTCRAGTETLFCFGESDSEYDDYAWYVRNSGSQPNPVAKKKENAFGMYDVHGNVSEWCVDRDGLKYEDGQVIDEAWDYGDSLRRVTRGGHFECTDDCTTRLSRPHFHQHHCMGLRPACSLPKE